MKKILSVLSVFGFLSLFAPTALSADACGGDTYMNDMPELTISNMLDVDVTSYGATAGVGEVTGIGSEFAGRVDRDSTLTLNTEATAELDGCDRNCGAVEIDYEGLAIENITSIGVAVGGTPGESVGVGGATQALTNLGLEVSISDFNVDDGDGN